MVNEKRNMMKNEILHSLSKEELIRLIEDYSKNWLAMDGVWFQSVERTRGMDEAMYHDAEAWRRFTVIEAKRIKAFLGLPERAGLEGLARALQFRFYANLNEADIIVDEDGKTLVYRTRECRVQRARERKGMPFHPCKPPVVALGGSGWRNDTLIHHPYAGSSQRAQRIPKGMVKNECPHSVDAYPLKMNIYFMCGWIYISSAFGYILHRQSKYYCVF